MDEDDQRPVAGHPKADPVAVEGGLLEWDAPAHGLAPVGTEVARRRGAGSRRGGGGGSPVRRATRPSPQARLARKPSASARTTSGAAVFSQPGTPGLLLALQDLVVGDEAAREMSLRRHPRGPGNRGVVRHVDGEAQDLAASLEPDRRLPVAVDGNRLGRSVDAVARGRQPVDHQPPALPRGGVEPGGVLGGLRGIDPHRGADLALVAAALTLWSVTLRLDVLGSGGPQPVDEHAHDREQRDDRRRFARPAALGRRPLEGAARAARRAGRPQWRRRSLRSAPREEDPRSRRSASRAGTSPTPRRSRPFRSQTRRPRRGRAAGGQARGRRARRTRPRRGRAGGAEAASPKTSPTIRAMAPRIAMKKAAAPRAPPRPIQIRAQTSATDAATASSTGSSTKRNWGTPKSNSAWKVERPINRPPIRPMRRRRTIRAGSLAGAGVGAPRAHPLDQQHGLADQGHPGAADQHQVGGPPQGHVLAEQPVPDVVEREADQGEGAAGGDQDSADGRVPVAGDVDGGRPGALLRQADGEVAGAEDAEQAGEDQVVGGVGERAGSRPTSMWSEMSQYMPSRATRRDAAARAEGRAAQPGRPETRSVEVGGAAEVGDLAAAVPHSEPGDRGAEHQRGAGGDDHLVEGGAAGGLGGGRGRCRRWWRRSRSWLCLHIPMHGSM